MDCMAFRKLIPEYINKELDDKTLNEFLNHLKNCDSCRDELEIHYIVMKGVDILDNKDGEYNLSAAFLNSVKKSNRYMHQRKQMLKVTYVIDSVVFWGVVLSIILFFEYFIAR